jgi:hypothetical protein
VRTYIGGSERCEKGIRRKALGTHRKGMRCLEHGAHCQGFHNVGAQAREHVVVEEHIALHFARNLVNGSRI